MHSLNNFRRWLSHRIDRTFGKKKRKEVVILPPLKPRNVGRNGYKPHAGRIAKVYRILDEAPANTTYNQLIEFVRERSGIACSRKLVSKWKKTEGQQLASLSRRPRARARNQQGTQAGARARQIITFSAIACVVLSCSCASPPANNSSSLSVTPAQAANDNSDAVTPSSSRPHTIRIELTVSRVEDLKVKAGDHINAGDVLTDRLIERAPLEAARQQAAITLEQMVHPKRLPVSRIAPSFYADVETSILRAQKVVDDAERKVSTAQQRIDELAKIENLPPSIRESEAAKRRQLEHDRDAASNELKLALAQLKNARAQRSTAEYMTARDNLTQQTGENERIQTANMQANQLRAQISSLDYQIGLLGVVRAPFAGTVKRVSWEGQQDHDLKIILTVVVDGDVDTNERKSKSSVLGVTKKMRPKTRGRRTH